MTTDIIVPSIREDSMKEFKEAWGFKDVKVVWDNEDTYAEIEKELGEDAWIISRKNAAIRCWGYLKSDADVILTMDDDCLPTQFYLEATESLVTNKGSFISGHQFNLGEAKHKSTAWQPTGIGKMRGLPYENLARKPEIVLSHGLWKENCDFDAITEIAGNTNFEPYEMVIPRGMYFPMCTMNLAFKKEIKPLMFLPMMGLGWRYDRWDDMWGGVLAKKVLDHLGLGVWSGSPYVRHSKKSDKWVNLAKENRGDGYQMNENFWERVDEVVLTKDSIAGAYIELAEKVNLRGDYFEKMRKAMVIWAKLTT